MTTPTRQELRHGTVNAWWKSKIAAATAALVAGVVIGALVGGGDPTESSAYKELESTYAGAQQEAKTAAEQLQAALDDKAALEKTVSDLEAKNKDLATKAQKVDEVEQLQATLAAREDELAQRENQLADREQELSGREAAAVEVEAYQETPLPAPAPAGTTFYQNCDAARAAGADPVYEGDPGYGPHLDRDRDGVGCE